MLNKLFICSNLFHKYVLIPFKIIINEENFIYLLFICLLRYFFKRIHFSYFNYFIIHLLPHLFHEISLFLQQAHHFSPLASIILYESSLYIQSRLNQRVPFSLPQNQFFPTYPILCFLYKYQNFTNS